MDNDKLVKVEFIELYIKHDNGDYQWNDNHGELIRCKDCKQWSEENESYYGRCGHIKRLTPFDWFCADGERKNNNG